MQFEPGPAVDSATVYEVVTWTRNYEHVVLDLGTGDGRYVLERTRQSPPLAAIGIDLCGARFRVASRKASVNARFLVANACALPCQLLAAADHVNIAFPWGCLLRGMLADGGACLPRLLDSVRPGSTMTIVINADAASSCNVDLPEALTRILNAVSAAGCTRPLVTKLGAPELKSWPSTWAKRLAYGRNPYAIAIAASKSSATSRFSIDPVYRETLYHLARCPVAPKGD